MLSDVSSAQPSFLVLKEGLITMGDITKVQNSDKGWGLRWTMPASNHGACGKKVKKIVFRSKEPIIRHRMHHKNRSRLQIRKIQEASQKQEAEEN